MEADKQLEEDVVQGQGDEVTLGESSFPQAEDSQENTADESTDTAEKMADETAATEEEPEPEADPEPEPEPEADPEPEPEADPKPEPEADPKPEPEAQPEQPNGEPRIVLKRKEKPKPQFMLVGPPMSGKKMITKRFEEEYGILPLTLDAMYSSEIESGSQEGFELKRLLDADRSVPEDLTIKLVIDRVKQGDAIANGYVVAGFPRTKKQANAIFDSGVPVSAMLVLDLDDNEVVERSKGRRIDPETKILYHVDYSPAENSDVAARLEKRPKDAEAEVLHTMDAFQSNMENVEEVFNNRAVDDEGNEISAFRRVSVSDPNMDSFDTIWKNIKDVMGAPPADEEAAAKIQALIRGRQERQYQKEKEEAAAKIQAIQRGRNVRKDAENRKELNRQVRFDALITALVNAASAPTVGEEIMNILPYDRDFPVKDFVGRIRRWKADPLPDEIIALQEQIEPADTVEHLAREDFPRKDGKGKSVMNSDEFYNCITSHGGVGVKKRRKEIAARRRRASVTEFSKRSDEFEIMFRELDLDQDGQLSMEEFHKGFEKKAAEWGYKGSMDAADSAELDMFREMDTDQSGLISFDEFKTYMDNVRESWAQENREEAAKAVAVAREKDKAKETEAALEYSLQAREDFEEVNEADEEGVYTRYNVPCVVVANAGTQATYVNKKANRTTGTGTSTWDDTASGQDWDSFVSLDTSALDVSGGSNEMKSFLAAQEVAENQEKSLWRDDGVMLSKIIRRYRPGIKYIFNFYSRTNAGNTAARASRGVATFEAIACEHSGVSRIMFRRLCADFGLLREDKAKARRIRRRIGDLCLLPEECMAIFDQHARNVNMVSSVNKGRGVLLQNEFAACLAQLADTVMEPYAEAYPATWRRVHAIFGRLDFGNILELRKRMRGKTGFGIGDGEPRGHGNSSRASYKEGFSYELSSRDWPNAPLTPLPQKRSRTQVNEPLYEKMLEDERHTMQLELATGFGENLIDFDGLQSGKGMDEGAAMKASSAASPKFQSTGATNPEEISSFLDNLGLTYGLEKKYVSGVRLRKGNSKSSLGVFANRQQSSSKIKPSPPPRSSTKKKKRVSPQRRLLPTQFDSL